MKKKLIRLTESDLRNLVSKTVKNILKEDYNNNTQNIGLSSQFEDRLDDLQSMYQTLKGFIGEYPIFVKAILKAATEQGLVLKNYSGDGYFNLEDAIDGRSYDFDFTFVFPNIDVNSMSDDEYEAFEGKLSDVYDNIEYMIGKPSFGTLQIYMGEAGINIYYSFKLVQNKN